MSDSYCIEQNKNPITKGLAYKSQGDMKSRYMHMPSLSMIVLKSGYIGIDKKSNNAFYLTMEFDLSPTLKCISTKLLAL